VRGARPVYAPLEKFVGSLGISFLTRVSDSDVYVDAAEGGLGVFEMPADTAGAEQREFLPIAQWAQGDERAARYDKSNVVPLNRAKS
jgi:hypothetical protein